MPVTTRTTRAPTGPELLLLGAAFAALLPLGGARAASAVDGWEARHQPRFEPLVPRLETPDGPVRSIVDDTDGLLWLVGGAELFRWDGGQLLRATAPGQEDARDAAAPVMAVARDASGAIWAGASPGLFRLDRSRPDRPLLRPVAVSGEAPAVSMFAFRESAGAGGPGWSGLAGTVGEVLVLDAASVVARLPIPGGGPNRLHALHVDATGRAWAGTSFGLYELQRDATSAWRWREQPLLAPRQRVAAITSDARGRLWVGTALDGLLEIGPEGAVRHEWPDGEPPSRIFSLEVVGEAVWVGTFGSGVWTYEPANRRWRVMRHDRGRSDSLQDDNVWDLHRDRRGLMWVGHGAGTQFLDPGQDRFLHIPLDPEPTQPAARIRVHALAAADADGRSLWLGLGNGRIRHIGDAPADAALDRRWREGAGEGPVGAVELLQPLPDGRWLLGSDWSTRLAPADGGPLRDLIPPARLPARYSSAVVPWDGAWWQAGPDGLWRLPLDGEGGPRLDAAVNLFSEARGERRVASLLARPETLWIGTWTGLSKLTVGAATPQALEVPGLAGLFVSSMAVDGTGRLWLATSEGGLFHALEAEAGEPGAWRRLGTAEGLPARAIAGLLIDAEGRPWISSARGLALIDPKDFSVRAFDSHDGASAGPYVRRAAALLPDGTLAFGGNDAITLVRPGLAGGADVEPTPALVLTGIRAGEGEPAPTLASGGDLPTWRFAPQVSRIEIDVVAPVFLHPERVRKRHRLVGIDAGWVDTAPGTRTSTYNYLPAGDYRFEAEYSLDGGPWTGTIALGVSRAPAWHEQPLARIAAALLGVLALVLAWRARSRVLRVRAAELERMVEARTAALAAANLELEQAHRAVEAASLTDPLTGLHNRRFLWRHIDADVALALRSRHGEAGAAREPADLLFFLVDIDHFKRINDQHGHAVGDLVLVEMARRLRTVFRESDYVLRWGGEEFLGVARGTPREEAPRVAERIIEAVSSTFFELPGERRLAVRCSVGFAAFPLVPAHRHAIGWEDTVGIADEALYEAKGAGRDRWAGFEASGAPVEAHHLAALRLRTASAMDIPGLRLRRSRD